MPFEVLGTGGERNEREEIRERDRFMLSIKSTLKQIFISDRYGFLLVVYQAWMSNSR